MKVGTRCRAHLRTPSRTTVRVYRRPELGVQPPLSHGHDATVSKRTQKTPKLPGGDQPSTATKQANTIALGHTICTAIAMATFSPRRGKTMEANLGSEYHRADVTSETRGQGRSSLRSAQRASSNGALPTPSRLSRSVTFIS